MKQFFKISLGVVFIYIITNGIANARIYTINPKTSKLEITVQKVKKSVVKATLSGMTGSISYDPLTTQKSYFNLTANSNTLHTGLSNLDKELKGERGFNVSKHPLLKIASTKVKRDIPGGSVFQINGIMTIKGFSAPVTIQMTAIPYEKGFIFRGTFSFSRSIYQIGASSGMEENLSCYIELRGELVQ